ncbi:hypothetical protein [Clostridium sp.]|uniref:hypothetical protein n=1 Tax=Clostridium sp. TaxID=1506 RepID=UPI0039956598
MKKLIGFMLVIISAISLMGCLGNDEVGENKIKAPALNTMSAEGVWEIVEEYTVKENNQLEKVEKIEKPLVSISAKEVDVQKTEIENPKFKFKKVDKEQYLPKEFNSIIKGIKEENKLIDVISISDNTNLYIDFIKENENRAYLYTVGKLLVIEKVAESSKHETKSNIDSTIVNLEKKKGQDSGVLLGIKEPGTILEDGEIKEASYKTIWIYSDEGKIQTPKVIDGLLLPRANGGFSDINMSSTTIKGEKVQKLNVVNQNKSGKIEENKKHTNNIYREITFVGKDYIGLQYYDELNKGNVFNKYKIIPVDGIENNKGLSIEDLYGEKGIEAYTNSRKKFISTKEPEFKENYDIEKMDMDNITMKRKNGKWVVEGNLNSRALGVEDTEFDLDLVATGTLVNWDSLPLSWNNIKELAPSTKDTVSSPIGDFMITLNEDSLNIYDISNLENIGKPIMVYPIKTGSSIVMSEWATGDEFVTAWDKVVDSKRK